jgi:hypothetical protein
MEIEDRVLVFIRWDDIITGKTKTAVGGIEKDFYLFMRGELINKSTHFPTYKEIQLIKPKFEPAY